MGWHGTDMTGRFTVVFSDRRTAGTQARFAPTKSDLQDITAFSDGRVRVMLRSWGDATIWLEDVQCYKDGFMTGINREGNGVSMMAFALARRSCTRTGTAFALGRRRGVRHRAT